MNLRWRTENRERLQRNQKRYRQNNRERIRLKARQFSHDRILKYNYHLTKEAYNQLLASPRLSLITPQWYKPHSN